MQSVANLCIIPMQDYLGLDNSARMNQPSTLGKNWKWRLKKVSSQKNFRKKCWNWQHVMEEDKKNNIKGYMLAILGGVSWGISGVCSQYLFTQYDLSADWLTAIRMLLSGILLLVLAFRKEHTRIFKIWTKGKDTFWLIAFALADFFCVSIHFWQRSNILILLQLRSFRV